MKYFYNTASILLVLTLSACGGSSSIGSDDDTSEAETSTALDTTVDYSLGTVLLGTAGASRTLSSAGTDSDGFEWVVNQIVTTLTAPSPTGPCLVGETQQDVTTTIEVDGLVATSSGPTCITTAGFIQQRLDLDVTETPVEYFLQTAAGNLPSAAKLGAGGLLGTFSWYQDSNGDQIYDADPGDNFIGSRTANWRLEDQGGQAALVISSVLFDEFGSQDFSETQTFFITPSGSITRFTDRITAPDIGFSVLLTGTVQ